MAEVIYADGFGNRVTGLRDGAIGPEATIDLDGRAVRYARVFADAPPDTPFWYVNSMGLVEIAVANGSAAARLDAAPGTAVTVTAP